jgi:hypothetical protein
MSFLKNIGDKVQSATGLDKDKKELEAERDAHNQTKKELAAVKAALQKAELELSRSRQQITDLNNQLRSVNEELDSHKSEKKAAEEAANKEKQEAARKAMEAMQLEGAAKAQANMDAQAIYEAGNGLLVNHEKMSGAIAPRSSKQLETLVKVFMGNYGKELSKYVNKSLSGNNRIFNLALLQPVVEFEAELLTDAMKGLSTDEDIIIEVLCSSTNDELKAIAEAYAKMNEGKALTERVQKCTSGSLKQLLTVVLLANRDMSTTVDAGQVAADAQTLWNANEGKTFGTDDAPFVTIFGNRSPAHLKALCAKYKEMHPKGKDVTRAIEGLGGNFEKAIRTLYLSAVEKDLYFANQLATAFEGLGCDEYKVIRTVVRRREKDWGSIKAKYNSIHSKDLVNRMIEELSGTLQKSVLASVGEPVVW